MLNSKCFKCNKDLSHDEIGLFKKLFNRGATEYMCIHCTSDYLQVPEDLLIQKIKDFKAAGCTLFIVS